MIQPRSLVPAFLWLEQYRSLWEERIDSFEEYVNQLNAERKKKEKE